jgi:hypothetical protein
MSITYRYKKILKSPCMESLLHAPGGRAGEVAGVAYVGTLFVAFLASYVPSRGANRGDVDSVVCFYSTSFSVS